MFKKEKCGLLFLGLLVAVEAQSAEQKGVQTLPLEECAARLLPEHQYLIRRHLLNDVADRAWVQSELYAWLKPFCLQCFFSCALEETYLVQFKRKWWGNSFGGIALAELPEQVKSDALVAADNAVKDFFSKNPCADFNTVKASELWRGTHVSNEPVFESDVDYIVEKVLNAIVMKK